MPKRRMFSLDIVDSDAFCEMPLSTQALYFHIGMRADDDGFCASPNKIVKITGASADDMKLLIAKKFLIPCENGIVVVKHWWLHNTKRKDTYTQSVYLNDNPNLRFDINKKSYTYDENCPRYLSVNEPLTQDKISKDNISKVNISKNNITEINISNEITKEKNNISYLIDYLKESKYISNSLDEVSITQFVIRKLLNEGRSVEELESELKQFNEHLTRFDIADIGNKTTFLMNYLRGNF